MGKISILLVVALIALAQAAPKNARSQSKYKVVCYLGTWANYRPDEGKFLIEDIEPTLCTHLVYAFAKLDGNRIAAFDPYLDLEEEWGLGAYKRFNKLREKNPELRTLLAIGGWNEGSKKYSDMAAKAENRKIFVESVVSFLEKYGFNGFDVDWEYPANRGGAPEDKQNYIHLLRELKEALGPRGYDLSAAVSAGEETIKSAYDIPNMCKYLDFVNVMAYDLHGSWDPQTGHNAPLRSTGNDLLTVEHAIDYWISHQCPPEKLILGMGLYGRSFKLVNPSNHGLGAQTSGPGDAGTITREPGMLGYNEICKKIKNEQWTVVKDETIRAPYAYKDNQWVGYDNEESLKEKVDFLKQKGLGGGMVWSLETDDFKGYCNGVAYPLLITIAENLNGLSIIPPTRGTPDPHKVTPEIHPPTPGPDDVLFCPGEGTFAHPKDCHMFYTCIKSDNGFTTPVQSCPPGTKFQDSIKACNHEDLVNC